MSGEDGVTWVKEIQGWGLGDGFRDVGVFVWWSEHVLLGVRDMVCLKPILRGFIGGASAR
jgi:hypothetical protein